MDIISLLSLKYKDKFKWSTILHNTAHCSASTFLFILFLLMNNVKANKTTQQKANIDLAEKSNKIEF